MTYDSWKTTEPDDSIPRPAGCKCHWEAGDSPCPVHGDGEPEPDDELRDTVSELDCLAALVAALDAADLDAVVTVLLTGDDGSVVSVTKQSEKNLRRRLT